MKKVQQEFRECSIYCIRNNKKGHLRYGWCYVGRTSGKNKIRSHRSDKGDLGKDLRAFSDDFVQIVVWPGVYSPEELGICTLEEIDKKEREYIKKYNCVFPSGYNLNHGGGGVINHTEETKVKMSKSAMEAHNRPEVKEKRYKSAIEAQNRPETKEKRRITNNKPGVKEKRSKSAIEAHNKPEVKEKQSKSAIEAHTRPETKEKHRKAVKEAMNRPEVKENHRKAVKEAMNRPEVKENHRKGQQERRRREREGENKNVS